MKKKGTRKGLSQAHSLKTHITWEALLMINLVIKTLEGLVVLLM
jgi:hypothetical protein